MINHSTEMNSDFAYCNGCVEVTDDDDGVRVKFCSKSSRCRRYEEYNAASMSSDKDSNQMYCWVDAGLCVKNGCALFLEC